MRIILMLTFLMAGQIGYSQRIVTGRVLDRYARTPVANVDVTIYKGTEYMSTNAQGYFQLTVNEGDSLMFLHPDYQPGLIAIPETNNFSVSIEKVISFPVYEEGISKLYQYIQQNIQYPNGALFKRKECVLIMELRVDSTGSVLDCKALNEVKSNFEKAAADVLMKIPGKWTASDRISSFIFPLVFKIENEDTKLSYPRVVLPEGKMMEQIFITASF